jgi:murein DD-endopeptidase MepM/ murein hydrolase activator NlpD
LAQDPSFRHPWSNDVCFTSRNDMSKLKDTLWLCVNDEYDQNFHMPAPGLVTSRYGPRNGRNHNGIDIDLETGDTIYATWSGKVRYAKYNDGGFGNLVIIRHPNGLETLYAHLSKFLVYPDQDIVAGEPIALGGNTGHSYGSHLHFEIRFYDAPMNPEEIIDFTKKELKNENLFVHKGLFRPGAKPSDY